MNYTKHLLAFAAGAVLIWTRSVIAEPLDGLEVVVNDSPITALQVQDGIDDQRQTLHKVFGDSDTFRTEERKLEDNEIEDLINNKLILNDFNSGLYNTNAVDGDVDKEIKGIIKTKYGGDRSRLVKSLQDDGRTFEDFRRQQRDDFIVYALSQQYGDPRKIIISPLKIQTYYNEHLNEFKVDDQVKMRMISIPQNPGDPPGFNRQVAEDALRKIDAGTPFAEMASEISSGSSRADGGELGWVERKDRVAALTDVAFSLKPGQHSQVIELTDPQSGNSTCYLLLVEDVRPAHVSPLSDVQAEIERALVDLESKARMGEWLSRLRAKSHIQNF